MNTINAVNNIRIAYQQQAASQAAQVAAQQAPAQPAEQPTVAADQQDATSAEYTGVESNNPALDSLLQKIRGSDLPISQKQALAEKIAAQFTDTPANKVDLAKIVHDTLMENPMIDPVFRNNFQEIARIIREFNKFESTNSQLVGGIKQLFQTYNVSA